MSVLLISFSFIGISYRPHIPRLSPVLALVRIMLDQGPKSEGLTLSQDLK